MRILILIALLFAFTAGSYIDIAHASGGDSMCTYHQNDRDVSTDGEPCHSEQEQNQCEDCCCVHSHSMTIFVTPSKTPIGTRKHHIIASLDLYDSAELSRLKRPPRL